MFFSAGSRALLENAVEPRALFGEREGGGVLHRPVRHPVQDLSKIDTDRTIGRGPDTQRESPKGRGIAGHIEQAERGAIRKFPQAQKHVCPLLLPTASQPIAMGFNIRASQTLPNSELGEVSRYSSLSLPCRRIPSGRRYMEVKIKTQLSWAQSYHWPGPAHTN
jgi:hypothetical protein